MTGRIPPEWKKGGLTYGAGLTLEIVNKMLEAAKQEAEKQGVPMTIAITDAGGNLIALNRMDNAILCSIQIAMDKAYTAVFVKLPTKVLSEPYKSGELVPLFFHERWITFPGGFPIISNGVILGGIGASGGSAYEDASVASAALRAGNFNTTDIDAIIAEIKNMAR